MCHMHTDGIKNYYEFRVDLWFFRHLTDGSNVIQNQREHLKGTGSRLCVLNVLVFHARQEGTESEQQY